ncbi:MAG: hypothetical protein R3F15_09955 [Lysobacterales bacterium]
MKPIAGCLRRPALGLLLAALGTALTQADAAASSSSPTAAAGPCCGAIGAPWRDYFGANTAGGFSAEAWRATVRSGYPRDSNVASISSVIDPLRLDEVLAAHDWVHLQDGYNYRMQSAVDAYFDAIRADHGAGWRANVAQLAEAMIDGMQRNSAGGHRAYWELGNEIYAEQTGMTIGTWVSANNLPYPHPNSNYNDNPNHIERPNDRGIIGYQVEYQMALAIEAILTANAAAPAAFQVPIMAPAAASSSVNNGWLQALMDYEIVGYEMPLDGNGQPYIDFARPLAASLAGMRFGDLLDLVNVHYVINVDGATVNTVWDNWIDGSTTAQGVFHTEEGGVRAAIEGRGGLVAMSAFARVMDVWLSRGIDPTRARTIFYSSGDGPPGTRGVDALNELHAFMPADATALQRKPGLLSHPSVTIESYAFEADNENQRALFVLPAANGEATLDFIDMRADGWKNPQVGADVHLWNDSANPTQSASVTPSVDGLSYRIEFPAVSFTAINNQALVILVQSSGESATIFADGFESVP